MGGKGREGMKGKGKREGGGTRKKEDVEGMEKRGGRDNGREGRDNDREREGMQAESNARAFK
eukprot:5002433-Pyramimonas_sp.AAC.1